jgi:cytochrome c oxidase assembly factor CtaG
MKNLRHPSFILAVVSIILLFIAIGLRANTYNNTGDTVILISVALGAIHWIWSIIDVATRHDMRGFQKRMWLIAVIACPLLGGMLFYALHQRAGKIVT